MTINQSINSMDEFKDKLDSTINFNQTQIPYVVLDKKNWPKVSNGDKPGDYNLLVAWPSAQEKYGRKDYMISKKGTHLHMVNVQKKDVGKLVQIKSLDPKDDIPLDQFVVKKGVLKYGVALDPGKYYVQITDSSGQIISKEKIDVL